MSYIALYRKFRPNTFEEVKGQTQVTTILKNQIKGNRIGHAYLFSGTRGTGKTSVAKIFAKAVNCEQPVEGSPCGICRHCMRIGEGANLNVIEMDAASSNGVDNIREIIEEVRYSPTEGRYKVYIIDEVHMLSIGAFNALLKTLEEPPPYVIFILATTEIHKIPVTILSRCQKYEFRRITAETIAERLKELMQAEGETYEEEAISFLARKGDGSMRDALSLLDQCLSFYFGETLTYENALKVLGAVDTDTFSHLFLAIREENVEKVLDIVEDISVQGMELGQFVVDFTWFFRNLLLLKVSEEAEKRIDISREKLKEMKKKTENVSEEELIRMIRILSKLSNDMKYAGKKRAELEIALIKLCKPEMERTNEALLARMQKLERMLERGECAVKESSPVSSARKEMESNSTKVEQRKIPKALPEEMKKIAKEFGSIATKPNIKQPFRANLKTVTPFYEEESESLVLGTEDLVTKEMIEKAENIAAIKENIRELIGKDCEVKVKLVSVAKKEGNTEILGLENIASGLLVYED